MVTNKSNMLTKAFTLDELEIAISSHKSNAPGLANIKYPMLQNLSANAKSYLLAIYNDICVFSV